jgi:hypothetical protein
MSWLSHAVSGVGSAFHTGGNKFGRLIHNPMPAYEDTVNNAVKPLPANYRRSARYGVAAALGGGLIGSNYFYARDRGMSPGESTSVALSGGVNYQGARGHQTMRLANDATDEANKQFRLQQESDAKFAQGQAEVLSRRRLRGQRASGHGGTLVTGVSGVPGSSTTGSGPGALLTGG